MFVTWMNEGSTDVIVGTGFCGTAVTEKARPALVPPPGAGEDTEIAWAPAFDSRLLGTVAESSVGLMKVVASGEPSHRAFDAGTKPAPVNATVMLALP
jgi:hypothetical protein